MPKLAVFLLIAVSLFVSLGFGSNIKAHKTQFTLNNPTATPTPKFSAQIEKIELNKNEIIIGCEPNNKIYSEHLTCPDDDGIVKVKTSVNNPKSIALSYIYSVSGGQIIGSGAEISWNLKGVRPENYTITVEIKGKRRVSSEIKSKKIKVIECDCPVRCVCPSLSVSGGGDVTAGETVNFEANVSYIDIKEIKYNWTVSQGEIIEGQGTPQIKVRTTKEMTGSIKATVEIGGILCDSCQRTAFETATIIK
jgi:hypothetical protein